MILVPLDVPGSPEDIDLAAGVISDGWDAFTITGDWSATTVARSDLVTASAIARSAWTAGPIYFED